MFTYNCCFRHICRCILSIVLFGACTACSKNWLDEKVDKTQAVPKTVKEMQAILDNLVYINVNSCTPLIMGEVAVDGHFYTDQVFEDFAVTNIPVQNAYTWSVQGNFDFDGKYRFNYQAPYTAISHCNIVLEVEQGDNHPLEFAQVRAQALFVRASQYHALAQIYAPAYKASSAKTDWGLALRLNADITEISVRASLEATYQQITKDLKAALDHLPDNAAYQTRPDKVAALGMLARVYLTMGDFEHALHYADEYLKKKSELIDYSQLSASADFIGLNREVAYLAFLTTSTYLNPEIADAYLIEQNFYDAYEENDLRKTVFFKPSAAGYVFKGSYTSRKEDRFFGLATDEIYLIRSECYARKGELELAMKDLNDLLRTRWAKKPDGSTTYTDQTAVDETDALNRIFRERKKQLILRGIRWSDLKRLNLDPQFAQNLQRTVAGKQYKLLPNSNQYIFPLPQSVIEKSGMPQNPSW